MAMIFQDVMNSLNPVLPIGLQMTEGAVRRGVDRARAREKAISLLDRVGVPDPAGTLRRFPHQLSGGQRQRVMIAMALMGDPRLLIADEPTTALDMTVQRQILQLLRTLQQDGLSVLLITHDMGVVAELADRVAVMYAGQCVEEAPCAALLQHPRHPYTQALLKAVPGMADPRDRQLYAIPGSVPQRYDRMEGCRFAPRCPHGEACSREAACRDTAGGYVRCSLDAAQ